MPQLRRARASLLAVLIAGIISGVVWAAVASPATLTVRPGGDIVLSETNAAAQFSVVMLFMAIGAVVSIAWGVYCALRFASWGAWMIPLAMAGAVIAAVLCWLVGVQLGPNDPRSLTHLAGGETVHDMLRVDSIVAFIIWPWFATLAAGLVTLFRRAGKDIGDDSPGDPHQIGGGQADVQSSASP